MSKTNTKNWLPNGIVMLDGALEILGEPKYCDKYEHTWHRRARFDGERFVLSVFHCGIVSVLKARFSGEGWTQYKSIISSYKTDEVKDICKLFLELKDD